MNRSGGPIGAFAKTIRPASLCPHPTSPAQKEEEEVRSRGLFGFTAIWFLWPFFVSSCRVLVSRFPRGSPSSLDSRSQKHKQAGVHGKQPPKAGALYRKAGPHQAAGRGRPAPASLAPSGISEFWIGGPGGAPKQLEAKHNKGGHGKQRAKAREGKGRLR
jgi:hypothetical protein